MKEGDVTTGTCGCFPFRLLATTVATVWIPQPVRATQHFLHMSRIQTEFPTLWHVLALHLDEVLTDEVIVEKREVGADMAFSSTPGMKV